MFHRTRFFLRIKIGEDGIEPLHDQLGNLLAKLGPCSIVTIKRIGSRLA